MHILQNMAVENNLVNKNNRTLKMQKSFGRYVASIGSVPESRFMASYFISTNPFQAFGMLPLAMDLIRHRRLSLGVKRMKPEAEKQLKTILNKAKSIRGNK